MRSATARIAVLVVLGLVLPASAGASMTLEGVTVEGVPQNGPGTWNAPEKGGTVTWTTDDWTGTYTFSPPQSIPDGGTTFPISVKAESRKNIHGQHTRFVPAMTVSSSLVQPGGRADVRADANSDTKPTDEQSTTVQVKPIPTPIDLIVVIQDGPTYTFHYISDQAPPTGQLPPPSPPSERPPLDEVTSYDAPAAGGTLPLLFPALGAVGPALSADVVPTAEDGTPGNRNDVVAGVQIPDIGDKALKLCLIFTLVADPDDFDAIDALPLASCLAAVSKVMTRAEQLRKQRAGPAQVAPCPVIKLRRQRARVRPRARVRCVPTQFGLRVTVRAKRGRSLRSALGKRPKLVIGRTHDAATAPGDRVNVLWQKP
jgi:hypothetical protein